MTRITTSILFAVCLLLTVTSCKDKLANLDGTTWKVVKMDKMDGSTVTPKETYTVEIKNQHVGLMLDINQLSFPYKIKADGKIHLEEGMTTLACCDQPEGEAIAAAMKGAFDIDLASNGATLILKGKDTIHLVPHAK